MMSIKIVLLTLLFSSVVVGQDVANRPIPELNTLLMKSTFKIESADGTTSGTAFVLGRPLEKDPKMLAYVLITAAHVLEQIKGDSAILYVRFRDKKDKDLFVKVPYPIGIRDRGKPRWIKHPSADVAVMYLPMPNESEMELVPISTLATDKILTEIEIHPGDEMRILGFPFGAESNEAGFPILRSGKIASYPLLPTAKVKTFLLDFNVFGGNSGSPVYFVESTRTTSKGTGIGTYFFLAGLVSEEKFFVEAIPSLNEIRQEKHSLGLAVVIHASLIKETIDLLPPPPEK